jgi:hypothetical protein
LLQNFVGIGGRLEAVLDTAFGLAPLKSMSFLIRASVNHTRLPLLAMFAGRPDHDRLRGCKILETCAQHTY